MVVTTHRNVSVTVTFLSDASTTDARLDHNKAALSNLAAGERVHGTPPSKSRASPFVAASATIQSTKVLLNDGVIYSLAPTSMIVTTSKGHKSIDLGAETVVVNAEIVSSLTSASLSAGQRVHVILVPGTASTSTPAALLAMVQNQS